MLKLAYKLLGGVRVLGTRSKRAITEISSGLPDDYKDVAKKARTFNYSVRSDGSRLNPFASPIIQHKFTTYVPDTFFSPITTSRIRTRILKLPNARRAVTFFSPSPGGKPKKAATPGGKLYARRVDFGSFQIFYSIEESEKEESENTKISDSQKQEIVQTIANYTEREFSFFATPEGLQLASNQTRTSQTSVTGIKAKDAAKQSQVNLPKNQIWHWMHLIAFFMKGKASQVKENLVAGTRDANIRHLFAELEVPFLLKHFPDGVNVFGKVLVNGNNVGKTLEYNIGTEDFTLRFTFDLQSMQRPNQIEGECLHEVVKVVLERSEEKKNQSFQDRLGDLVGSPNR